MGITNRVTKASGAYAEGDKNFIVCVYNSATVILIGCPVYLDVTDAAEWNADYGATQLSPAVAASAKKVLPGTAGGNLGANPQCVGVYQPLNLSDAAPGIGSLIRVQDKGAAIVSAQSPAGGAAGTVGAVLIISTTVVQAVPGAAVVQKTIGIILATRTFVTPAASIFAAASATVNAINAYIALA